MQCYYRFFNKTGLRELDNVHCSRMRMRMMSIEITADNGGPRASRVSTKV